MLSTPGGVLLAMIVVSLLAIAPDSGGAQTPGVQETAGDVPMFRGDAARTGEMPGREVAGEPVLLWQVETASPAMSTPAIVDGVAYFGDGLLSGGGLRAVDFATGQELWVATLPGQPFGSSPAVVDGVVYIGDLEGNVTAVDAVTGQEAWSVVIGGDVTSSPAVVDGTVYIRNGEDALHALDAATGTE